MQSTFAFLGAPTLGVLVALGVFNGFIHSNLKFMAYVYSSSGTMLHSFCCRI
jgi:hypothetical protein